MKKALWITNKNEWDRKIKLDLPYQRPEGIMSFPPTISIYRSNLQHAVSLLWRTWQLDLFDKLILTNDGSTDNTFLIMQQIQQALGSDKVIIAGDNHNQGKWVRYIEAMDIAQEHGMDIVVSTDADMTDPWNMLPELIQHMEQNRSTLFHVICPMYETNEIMPNCTNGPGQTVYISWTRGTLVNEWVRLQNYMKEEIETAMRWWKYSLEPALNFLFSGHCDILPATPNTQFPIFLKEYREGMSTAALQIRDRASVYRLFTWEEQLTMGDPRTKFNFFYNLQNGIDPKLSLAPSGVNTSNLWERFNLM